MFIIAGIIARLTENFLRYPDAVMIGARHITANNIAILIQTILNVIFTYLFVIVWRIQETWGIAGLVLLLGFNGWVPWVIKTILCYIYIEKKILHFKVYWMNTFAFPLLASLPHILVARWWFNAAFLPMKTEYGIEIALAISLALLFILILLTYFPIIALLGGFDDYQMFVFRKAVDLSGPSKPIFRIIQKLMNVGVKLSKKLGMHGRFPIPYEEAHKEIRELMEIKRAAMKTLSEPTP